MALVTELAEKAAKSAQQLANTSSEPKNKILLEMAMALRGQSESIVESNPLTL